MKEKVYDFGMFGKWSESTFKEQLFIEPWNYGENKTFYYVKLIQNSALDLLINNLRPKFKSNLFMKYLNLPFYLDEYFKFKALMDEFDKDYNKIYKVLSEIEKEAEKNDKK